MKETSKDQRRGAVSFRMLAVLAAFCALPVVILAQSPSWWTTRNVLTTSGTANDYGAVNQGQLKNMALGAYKELQSLPGGVGDTSGTGGTGTKLNGMIMSWGTFASGTFVPVSGTNINDYAPVNIGQLKNVASLFYNRLIEVGYQGTPLLPGQVYPWNNSAKPVNDYGIANIGQLKFLFSFDVNGQSIGEGVPDWWETKYFGSGTGSWLTGTATAPSGALDGSGNPMTVEEAYTLGVSPVDYYNGVSPLLLIVSGTNQTGAPGEFLGNPLVVNVSNAATGEPLVNAPVKFTVNQGGGELAITNSTGATMSGTVQLRTDINGNVQAYYQQPAVNAVTSVIDVTAGTAPTVEFTSIATSGNGVLVAEWKFDDTGDTASDSSGYYNTGALAGDAWWGPGFGGGGALQFYGTIGHVEVPDSNSLALGTGAVTIAAWVQLASGVALGNESDVYDIVYKGTSAGDGFQFALEGGAANGLIAQVFNNGSAQQVTPSSDQSALLGDGNWHHVAFVRDESGNATLYIDGNAVGNASGMTATMTSSQPLWIGKGETGGYFNGVIDDVSIQKAAETGFDIAGAYNQDSNHNGIPDWWEFKYFGESVSNADALAPRGDGLTIQQAYTQGVNPIDLYNGQNPDLSYVSGSNQAGFPGFFLASPLIVHVEDANGNLLRNAPVVFTVTQGQGVLAASNALGVVTRSGTLQALTDSNGNAQVYYQEPFGNGQQSVTASAEAAVPVQFVFPLGITVADWEFNEWDTTATDSSGYGNNGTLNNGAWWSPSIDGSNGEGSNAITFDGGSGYVEVPDSNSLALGTGPVTIAAWVQLTSGVALSNESDVYDIVYKGTSTGDGFQFALEGGAANGLIAQVFNNGSAQQVTPSSDQSALLGDGNWHHVAFVRDESGNATLYIDGNAVGNASGMTATMTSSQPLWIGKGETGGYFNGKIDKLVIQQIAETNGSIVIAHNMDSNHNGIPDWWELKYFSQYINPNTLSPSNDGYTLLQEYQLGRDPNDYYNGVAPVLSLVSGNGQIGLPGSTLPTPLAIRITDSNGDPIRNAPLTFTVTQGNGLVSGTYNYGLYAANPWSLTSDINGYASVYYVEGSGYAPQIVSVTAGNAVPLQFSLINGSVVAEWKFSDSSGTMASDSSGYGNNGALSGTTQWQSNFDANGGLQFDGASGYVQVPDSNSLALGTGAVTIAAWVQLASGVALGSESNVYDIVYKGTSAGDGFQFALEGGAANGLIAQVFNNGSAQQVTPSSDQSALLGDGNWHHVAFVRDESGNATLYIDGNAVGNASGMTATMTSSQPLWIGKGETGGYFNGTLDHIIIQEAAIAATGIAASYNQDTDGYGLPDWWQMKYFGSLGIYPWDYAPRNDGLTNSDAYQQGLNPIMGLVIASGSDQWIMPNQYSGQPLAVRVADGSVDVPIAFSVTQGGAQLASGSGTATSSKLSVSTDGDGNASVYIYMPDNASAYSTITITGTAVYGSTVSTTSVSTTARKIDAGIVSPTNLTVTAVSPNAAALNWTNNSSAGTLIEISRDNGATWQKIASVASGVNSYIVTGLIPDASYQFRLAALAPTGSMQEGALPGTGVSVIPLSKPTLFGNTTGIIKSLPGFAGFSGTNYYLQASYLAAGSDGGYLGFSTDGTYHSTATIDPVTNVVTSGTQINASPTGSSNSFWVYGTDPRPPWVDAFNPVSITKNTLSFTYDSYYPQGPSAPYYWGMIESTLSDLYTLEQFKPVVVSQIPPFGNNFEQGINSAGIYSGTSNPPSLSITNLQYKWKVNAGAGTQVMWDERFTPSDGSKIIHNIRTWMPNGATESPVYEIDPATSNGGNYGTYAVTPLPVSIAPAGGQDTGATYLADVSGQPDYVVPQQRGGIVTLQALLPDGVSFSDGYHWAESAGVQPVPGDPGEVMVSTDSAQTIQVELLAANGDVAAIFEVDVLAAPAEGKVPTVAEYIVNQIEDETGQTHQKIALNGTPMFDRKPQAKEQTDNKTDQPPYIDALNLGLHYTVTDMEIPLPSGELSLGVKRTLHPEIWNFRHGILPGDRPDEPFGCSWSSNLVCGIEFVNQQAIQAPLYRQANYAYVTDELGARYRFLVLNDNGTTRFLPLPASISDQDAYLTILTFDGSAYTFTKPHGTVLHFEPTSVTRNVLSDVYQTGVIEEVHGWARVTTITDRVNESLTYHYNSATDLVPGSIEASTGQTITVNYSGGLVRSITGPTDATYLSTGNTYAYSYDANSVPAGNIRIDAVQLGVNTNYNTLKSVTSPTSAQTRYYYDVSREDDVSPPWLWLQGLPTDHYHCDLSKITDALGNFCKFDYNFDHTRFIHNIMIPGTWSIGGMPRNVAKVTLPNSAIATFQNNSQLKFSASGTNAADPSDPLVFTGSKNIVATDAEGKSTTYTFGGAQFYQLSEYNPMFGVADYLKRTAPRMVVWSNMSVVYPDNLGSEYFVFDSDAGLAVKSARNIDGNVSTYEYGDTWNLLAQYPWLNGTLSDSHGLSIYPFGHYPEPTRQVNPLGGTSGYSYNSLRLVTSGTDELSRETDYSRDGEGRIQTETIKDPQGNIVMQGTYTYDATYEGFVTSHAIKSLGLPTDPQTAWSGDAKFGNLKTAFVPDAMGRIYQKITDPDVLALTSTFVYDADNNVRVQTDPRGNSTTFTYDTEDRLTQITYPPVNSVSATKRFVYDSVGNKAVEYDENGVGTFHIYDSLNRVIKQVRDMNGTASFDPATNTYSGLDAAGNLASLFTYNNVNSKLTSQDPDGNITSFAYDSLQRPLTSTLTAASDPVAQRLTQYFYDSGHNTGAGIFDPSGFKPNRIIDPRGYETDVTYDALYRTTDKVVFYSDTNAGASLSAHAHWVFDAVGNAIEQDQPADQNGYVRKAYTAYDALNRPTVLTHEDNTTTLYGYTSTGLKWKAIDERSNETDTQYDSAGRPVYLVTPAVDNGSGTVVSGTTRSVYDGDGNVIHTVNPLAKQWDFAYDSRNHKTDETEPSVFNILSGVSEAPHLHWDYDKVGNIKALTDAKGQVTTKNYDNANRAIETDSPSVPLAGGGAGVPKTFMQYDGNGNVVLLTDPDNHVTTNTYGALNQLLTTTDAESITVTNGYDESGNRISVQDGLFQTTTFSFDGLSRNTGVIDMAGDTTLFNYDAVNKTSRKDANGNVANYSYDSRNRVTQVSYVDSLGSSVNDAVNSTRNYLYQDGLNLTSVCEPGKGTAADVVYSYDALNRMITEKSGGLTHHYSYDLAGNRVTTVYGGTGRTIASTYDALNRLSTMTEGGRTTLYEYDLNGNIGKKTLGNQDVVAMTFDALNRAVSETGTNSSAAALYGYNYGYDLMGNVLSIGETYPGGLNNRTVTNTYDAIYRLLSEADTTGGTTSTTSYTYDAANNRKTKILAGTAHDGTTNYTYNSVNQMTGSSDGGVTVSGTYDANGNRQYWVKGGSMDTYNYDFENRLVGLSKNITGHHITTGSYAYMYDYRTRRVLRNESAAGGGATTKLVFSGGTSVQELDNGSSTPTVEYIRGSDYGGGIGGMLYTLRSGTASYTHENKRGDVVAKTDASGSLTYQAAYLAFGKHPIESGTTADRQKANTKDEDPTGLLDEGFRYRDLDTGSFITKDPAGFVDGPNVYTYVRQNPWTSVDPQGLSTELKLNGSTVEHDDDGSSFLKVQEEGKEFEKAAYNLFNPTPDSFVSKQGIYQEAWDRMTTGEKILNAPSMAIPLFLDGVIVPIGNGYRHAYYAADCGNTLDALKYSVTAGGSVAVQIALLAEPEGRLADVEIAAGGAAANGVGREAIMSRLNQVVDPSVIRSLDAEAMVGYRGSLASGVKYETNLPFNASNFDVDAFIVSDKLAAQVGNRSFFRDAGRIPILNEAQSNIDTTLRLYPEFQGMRKDPFTFRIFTTKEWQTKYGKAAFNLFDY